MSSPSLLIHVGYHKTGSTWLQNVVFPNQELGFAMPVGRRKIVTEIVRPAPFQFDRDKARRLICPALEAAHQAGQLPVLSCENLSGAFLAGGHDSHQNADRLQQLFPEAKILLVLREQRDLLRSSYSQYVKAGGMLSIKRWLAPQIPNMHQVIAPYFLAEFFQFHHLISHYQQRFGKSQVLVLPYEQLRDDPSAFTTNIMRFCDLDPNLHQLTALATKRRFNQSLSLTSLTIKRYLNRLIGVRTGVNQSVLLSRKGVNRHVKKQLERLDRWLPASWVAKGRTNMQRTINAHVQTMFRESNRLSAELSNLDLKKWGYDL